MSPNDSHTLLLTSDHFGSVEDYGPTVPLAKVKAKDSLRAGRLYLRATLDEMLKIQANSKNFNENYRDLLRETNAQYKGLVRQSKELELRERRKLIVKILSFFSTRSAKQAFLSDAHELWDSTMTTSERIKRACLSRDLESVESESIAGDTRLSGVALELGGPITQETIDSVGALISFQMSEVPSAEDPFEDPPTSEIQDVGQTPTANTTPQAGAESTEVSPAFRRSTAISSSSSGSASSVNYLNINLTVINSTDAKTQGLTINNNGSGNSG